jgi:hypothetical protein
MASKTLQLAKYTIERVLPELKNDLCVNGIDFSSALRGLAAAAAKSTERLTDGQISLTGHTQSLVRVGKKWAADFGRPDMLFERVQPMEGLFGSKAVVYATVDRRKLLNSFNPNDKILKLIYAESDYCKLEHWDVVIDTMRGYFELLNLGLKMENFFDDKKGEFFPVRGTKYLRSLVKTFDHEPRYAALQLLSDFDRAEMIY